MARMHRPETVTIQITQGDWLLLKKRLTAGESRRVFARSIKTMASGERLELNPEMVGKTQIMEYLLDWSFTDCDGKPIVVRGKSPEDVGKALDALDLDSYVEVREAVDAHIERMDAERDAEKNARAGEMPSSATSPSAG